MQDAPRNVQSNQDGPHPRLAEVVRRHLDTTPRKPVAEHNRAAFATLESALAACDMPLALDSFCGTARSTARLAQRHPGHLVVGIDKSAHRLSRHRATDAGNYLLLRADCEAIWELLAAGGRQVDYHYLLYPNPWPKAAHLQRRVHGHPAFRHLLALGGHIELRSNWRVYVQEFAAALRIAGYRAGVEALALEGAPLTRRRWANTLGGTGQSDELNSRSQRDPFSRAAEAALWKARFIPGYYQGRPTRMRYYEVLCLKQ